MLRAVLVVAMGDIRLALKERAAIFWMILMPVAFIGLFGGILRAGTEKPPTGLTVIDEDGSHLSRDLVENLRGEGFAVRLLSAAQRDTAPEGLRSLVIPKGFVDSLAAGVRVGLRFSTRNAGGGERDIAAEVHVQKAVVRMLAILAEMDTSATAGALQPGDPAFEQEYRRLRERPDLVRTVVRTAGKGRAVPQGFAASAPAVLVLFVLINTVIYGAVLLTEEKQSRCLARLAGQPLSRVGLLAGKVAGRLGFAMLQSALLLVLGRVIYAVYWGPSLLGLALLLVSLGLACASLGILLGAILQTVEQASALGWIVPLFLGAIGGCWWPLELVPGWMRIVGHISPAAWAMDGLHGLISFGKGFEVVVVPSLILLGYATILLVLGARKLRFD